ncbi:hypothetical protein HK096_003483, partial [Nowakowskiella sp. JEL0078]
MNYGSPTQAKALPTIPAGDSIPLSPRLASLSNVDKRNNQPPSYQTQYQSQRSWNQQGSSSPSPPPASSAADQEEKPYLARRLSRQVVTNNSLSRPTTPVAEIQQPSFPLHSNASSPIPSVELPLDITSKSKDDILKLHMKLVAEVNIKNKIIYDMKAKENWLLIQVASTGRASKSSSSGTSDADFIGEFEVMFSSKDGDGKEESDLKKQILQSMIYFKKELAKAKTVVDEVLEEEIAHLRSVVSAMQSSPSAEQLDRTRITELENKIRTAQTENSSLQSKVALWARASKRNQEARIQAEACQRDLESEISSLKSQTEKTKESWKAEKRGLEDQITSLKNEVSNFRKEIELRRSSDSEDISRELQRHNFELENMITERDAKLEENQMLLEQAQTRILEFDQTMQEAVTTVDELERENSSLRTELRGQQQKMEDVVKNALVERESEWAELQATARDEIQRVRREKDELTRTLKGRQSQVESLLEKVSELESSQRDSIGKIEFESNKFEVLKIQVDQLERGNQPNFYNFQKFIILPPLFFHSLEIQKVRIERESAISALHSLASPSDQSLSLHPENVSPAVAAAAAAAHMRILQEELTRDQVEMEMTKEQLSDVTKQLVILSGESKKEKDQLKNLEEKYLEVIEEAKHSASQVEALKTTIKQQEEQLHSFQSQLLDQQEQISHHLSSIQSAQFQLEERSNDVDILSSRLTLTEQKLRSAEELLRNQEESVLVLKQQLNDRTAELGAAEATAVEFSEILGRVKEELTESERKVVRLENVISEAADAVALSDDDTVENIETEKEEAPPEDVLSPDSHKGEMSDEAQPLVSEVQKAKLKSTRAHVRASLSAGMTTELAFLRTQLEMKQDMIETLEDKLRQTKEAMDALADELRSTHGTIEALKRKSLGSNMSPDTTVMRSDDGNELEKILSVQREKIVAQTAMAEAAGKIASDDFLIENEGLRSQVESLTSQVNSLKERLH